jgi:DNA gyrase subunit A
MTTRAEDFTEHAFVASNHSYILIFTDQGRLHWLKVYRIPEVSTAGRGRPINNLIRIEREERIADMIAVKEFSADEFVVFATARGLVKKTPLADFSNPRAGGIVAQTIREGDRLISAIKTGGDHQLFLSTRNGLSIRFHESDVRPMGRAAQGVIGIRLEEDDEVVSLTTFTEEGRILTVTEKGFGKKTATEEYRLQGRGGKGIRNLRISAKNGSAVGAKYLLEDRNLFLVTANGQIIRMNTENISTIGRSTLGVKLIGLDEGDFVTSLTLVDGEDEQMVELEEDANTENSQ